jgi:hypothetical protein
MTVLRPHRDSNPAGERPGKKAARDVLVNCRRCKAVATGHLRGRRLYVDALRVVTTPDGWTHDGCGGRLAAFDNRTKRAS